VAPNKLNNASIDCVTYQYKNYISEHTDLLDSLITSEQWLLVDAPTGSGKSFAFIDAMKRKVTTHNAVYVFFTPYRALTEQLGKEYNVTTIVGQEGKKVDEKKLFNVVKDAMNQKKRVFVLTYDMAVPFQNVMKLLRKEKTIFHCAVDEWHKIQDDYNYRGTAIRNLLKFLSDCKTVIGLSGTTQEIDVSNFEQKIAFTPIEQKSIFDSLLVVKTKERKEYLPEVAYLTENLKTKLNNKALIFLNNTKELKVLYGSLAKRGLKVAVLTSADKRSDAYRFITEEGIFPNNIDVILTTNVIADGVSIKNDHNLSVVIVSHEKSPIYKATQIKQMSHRPRNSYNHIILFTLYKESKDDRKLIEPHTYYHWMKEGAEDLREEMSIYRPDRFYASDLERDCAIYQENDEVKVDYIRLRHQAYSRSDHSMRYRTDVFIKSVENILGQSAKSIGTVDTIVERWENVEVLNDYKDTVQSLKEIQELEEKEKLEQFPKIYDRNMHIAAQTSDELLLNQVKKSAHHRHYKALLSIAPLTNFETSKVLIHRVEKDAQIHEYSNRIRNLIEVIGFKAGTVDNKTKKALAELSMHIGIEHSIEEVNNIVKELAKRFNKPEASIKKLLNSFVVKAGRMTVDGVRLRTKTLERLIDIEHITKQFGISTEAVIYSLEKGVDLLIDKDNKTIFRVPVNHEIEAIKRGLK
ncbi:DEAD/DEAH box helicase family protein, partial [Bacillus cereus]